MTDNLIGFSWYHGHVANIINSMVEKCYKIHVTHLYEIYGYNTCEIYVQPLFKIAIHRALFTFHVNTKIGNQEFLGLT